ncbi:MAG: D-amino-acid transaminase [Gammaproteobacteria bacterium]|nr:D-amino-acid transaminase [Gammaproteobacteria bacterium]
MTRTVYVNGEFLPEQEAKISVFDRGFLFADGVYEVTSVLDGRLVDNPAHLKRLHRSLNELEMAAPATDDEIVGIQQALVEKNHLREGMIYLQVTRGAAERDFNYPDDAEPSLVMFIQEKNILLDPRVETGISIITTDDIRWRRRDIKTVGLLAASMAKMVAKKAGADDAWMVEEGFITEGSSNNAYIIQGDGTLVTRHLGNEILSGITRQAVLKLAAETDINIEERPFTVAEAEQAREAFITSATTLVMPVVAINGRQIADGKPGALTRRLREIYIQNALQASAAA